MNLKCQHCGYEWNYQGRLKHNASCPDCQKKTAIGDNDESTRKD